MIVWIPEILLDSTNENLPNWANWQSCKKKWAPFGQERLHARFEWFSRLYGAIYARKRRFSVLQTLLSDGNGTLAVRTIFRS